MPGYYKYCIVPKCTNTTFSTPEKLFFHVPKDPKMRKKWCTIMKRDDKIPLSCKATRYCCEDHFDVEADMENYIKYKLVGGKLKLKIEVLPHKFDCQKPQNNIAERPGRKKRKRKNAAKNPRQHGKKLKNEESDKYEQKIKNHAEYMKNERRVIAEPEAVPEADGGEVEDSVQDICRVCLASGVRMHELAAGLQETFEQLTGTAMHTVEERPRHVCYVCCSQLLRSRAFCARAREAERCLSELVAGGRQITEQEVYKYHLLIKPKLNVQNNPLIAIHTHEDPDECASLQVKVEVDEVQDENKSDSDTESEKEMESEVKPGISKRKRCPEGENETEEFLQETESEIKLEEVKVEEFDPFEDVEDSIVRDESCHCLQCAEGFPSQSDLYEHLQTHTPEKPKQVNRKNVKAKRTKTKEESQCKEANSTGKNVKDKRTKTKEESQFKEATRKNVKSKRTKTKTEVQSQCKFCNKIFKLKSEFVSHIMMEHDFGELPEKPKRRKPNILKKT